MYQPSTACGSTAQAACPTGGHLILGPNGVDQVLGVLFSNVFDAKVVDH